MKCILLSLLALFVASTSLSVAAEKKIESAGEVAELSKQASACRRKAMDYRILSLNALKNADAVRGKAHETLVTAMKSGDSQDIDTARDRLDDAAEDLEDAIEAVEKVVKRTVKADISAKNAESICKDAAASKDKEPTIDVKKVKSLIASASKSLAKAESISKKLRKDWLEPVFATTSTTSTTSTTLPGAAAGGK
jgi:hypothetical protein